MATKSGSQDRRNHLNVFDAPKSNADQVYTFKTDELSAHCPFDFGGPDFYSFTLRYIPDELCIESKSLKMYIGSFRNVEITAEDLGAEMYSAFDDVISPETMYIRLEQARRGGMEETVEYGNRTL